jgi:hypothetical protein
LCAAGFTPFGYPNTLIIIIIFSPPPPDSRNFLHGGSVHLFWNIPNDLKIIFGREKIAAEKNW